MVSPCLSPPQAETILRFNNELVLVTVTAAGLKTLLENGVSRASAGQTSGRFPQLAGLNFSFDTTDAENKPIPVEKSRSWSKQIDLS